jgi:hypothetical protein
MYTTSRKAQCKFTDELPRGVCEYPPSIVSEEEQTHYISLGIHLIHGGCLKTRNIDAFSNYLHSPAFNFAGTGRSSPVTYFTGL